jgi:hypothetical protein
VRDLETALTTAYDVERRRLPGELAAARTTVRSEKLGEVAAEFEHVHNIERALQVGSVHAIIPARRLRPHLIDAVERGMERSVGR